MRKRMPIAIVVASVVLGTPGALLAAGPVDGEVGFLWWQTDFARNTALEDVSVDAGAPGYRGELWFFNKVGVRASLFSSDLGDLNEDDADYVSADVFWKLFSPTEDSFFALGVGWQDMGFTESGVTPVLVETAGVRVTAEGRIGLAAMLYAFGRYSYLPALEDHRPDATGDVFTDLKGWESEIGLAWKMGPFVDMRAGYRATELDFRRTPALLSAYTGTVKSEGYMIGFGIHF